VTKQFCASMMLRAGLARRSNVGLLIY